MAREARVIGARRDCGADEILVLGCQLVPLTKSQEERVVKVLKAKAPACPMCHYTNRLLAPDVYLLPIVKYGGSTEIKGGQPCVSLVCSNCGYMQLFNVYALGLGEFLGLPAGQSTP